MCFITFIFLHHFSFVWDILFIYFTWKKTYWSFKIELRSYFVKISIIMFTTYYFKLSPYISSTKWSSPRGVIIFSPRTNRGTRTKHKQSDHKSRNHKWIKGYMLFFPVDGYHQPYFINEKRKQIALRYITQISKTVHNRSRKEK